MIGLDFEFDLKQDKHDQIDSGGRVEPGWYKCTLKDVHEDDDKNCLVFEFSINGGAYDGQKQWYRLYDPETADDDAKRKKAQDRMKMIAGRLGLITKDQFGRDTGAAGSWLSAIGNDYVIQVTKGKDNYVGIDYAGIYPPTHEKLPKDVRIALGLGDAPADAKNGHGHKNGGGPAGSPTAVAAAANPRQLSLDDL